MHIKTIVDVKQRKTWDVALWELHKKIFKNPKLTKKIFIQTVVDPDQNTRSTKIDLFFKNENLLNQETLVGYCAYHIHNKEYKQRPIAILKAEAGLLKEYRGQSSTFSNVLKEAIVFKMKHPNEEFYLFEMLINPSSFHLLSKYVKTIYPKPNQETPPELENLMKELVRLSGMPTVGEEDLRVDFGLYTIESAEDKTKWEEKKLECPDVNLFLEKNPTYSEGHGLATLVPITCENLAAATWNYTSYKRTSFFNEIKRIQEDVNHSPADDILYNQLLTP